MVWYFHVAFLFIMMEKSGLCSSLTAMYPKNCLFSKPMQKNCFNPLMIFSNLVLSPHNMSFAKQVINFPAWLFWCLMKIPWSNWVGRALHVFNSCFSFRYRHMLASTKPYGYFSVSTFCSCLVPLGAIHTLSSLQNGSDVEQLH